MKSRLLATAAAIGLTALAFGSPAHAVTVNTTDTFFTAPTAGTVTFSYEGFSASDTDLMRLAINGQQIFINKLTPVGTLASVQIPAGLTRLQLDDLSTGNTWFSGTAGNSDNAVHLIGHDLAQFGQFNIGAVPAVIANPANCVLPNGVCYFGWEDRVNPSPFVNFNDLVFNMEFTSTSVPEPASLTLLGAALVGMGWLARRRHKTV